MPFPVKELVYMRGVVWLDLKCAKQVNLADYSNYTW